MNNLLPIMLYDFLVSQRNHTPIMINYDITWRCNLRCSHCYYWRSFDALGIQHRELTKAQWVREFYRARGEGTFNASLTGGEPTLRMGVIEAAYRIFPAIQIATNGIIKIPKRVRSCIWVSIDGDEATHNRIRGANIYQKVLENIQGDERVSISTTITSQNYDQTYTIVEQLSQVGVRGIFFMLFSGSRNDPLYLSGRRLLQVIKDLRAAIADFPDFVLFTDRMVELIITKEFTPKCPFLTSKPKIKSYFADLTPKRCVMGDNVDCFTCACIVPLISYCLDPFRFGIAEMRNHIRVMRTIVKNGDDFSICNTPSIAPVIAEKWK